jgi:crotonobetainyl-CoA:carnitine CoA-transferase CaiB-like acyl-CoA transferase
MAVNLPADAAGARLAELGARVTKVEPPGGDPLGAAAGGWYDELVSHQTVIALDLKNADERGQLDELLGTADILITATRPRALRRLGLAPDDLTARFPRLMHVAIVGHPPPHDDVPGHDLTYQASLGLLAPPSLPRTLIADLAGAEQAVSAALALALARERGRGVGHVQVALSRAADVFGEPFRHGLTAQGGLLGGGFPLYGLYETKEGWVAIAALEPQFRRGVGEALGVEDADGLAAALSTRTALEWEAWAAERDLPILAVRQLAE